MIVNNNQKEFMQMYNQSAYYNYDASGNRNFKFTGPTQTTVQNGTIYNQSYLTDQTLYASDLITINNKGYTKHYFEEGKRICSKIGGGFTNNFGNILYDHVQSLRYSYAELGAFLTGGIRMTFNKCLGVDVVIAPKPPFINIIQSNIGQNNPEPTFYYHTDHLGSSSYLTDDAGNITQTLNYLPYGETWVDIQTFNMIDYNLGVYLFNGKEKDQETGYNYFGARYYDDERISWLSVDPLSDKYPSISPYNYCMWNPVKYIDPNGEEIGDPLKKMKVRRNKISNTFGFKIRIGKNREKTNHQGIDYYAPAGTSTLAVKDGIVVWTRSEKDKKGYGNQILIKLNNENGEDLYAFYAHLSEIFVNAGDKVNEGDVIGKTGNTGNAFNMQGEDEHLHFELRETDAIIGGMQKRRDPNEIVDTKFEPDPNNKGKVRKVENNNPIKKHNDE